MKDIHIEFMVAKKEGYGEDSEPLSFNDTDIFAVGVFDGMGGTGAAPGIVKNEDRNTHSQAYYASRLVKSAVEKALYENEGHVTIEILKSHIKKIYEENVVKSETGLRTRLLRPYPTTMAIVTVTHNDDNKYDITSFWAGDSRNYLWSLDGFYQISKDDLKGGEDPFENLRSDGVLSNCISSDFKFDINELKITMDAPFIVLSATDGCFGYFQAPMYFEHILKQTLQESGNEHEWQEKIKERILKVTGDDISLSLRVIGISDFDILKKQFGRYFGRIVEGPEAALLNLKKAEKDLDRAREKYKRKLLSHWEKYKVKYMHYFPEEGNDSDITITSCNEDGLGTGVESKGQSGEKKHKKVFPEPFRKNSLNRSTKNGLKCKREK